MAEDVKGRVLRYLQDAHAAEQGGLKAMNMMLKEATDPDVKSALSQHIQVTQSQAQRLEARIQALGGETNDGKSLLDTIIGVGSHFANIFHDKEDKQTQDLIKAAALEEFEVGAYNALQAFAGAVGDHETAHLANTIMGEEQLAGERLQRLIPQVAVLATGKTTGAATTAV